MEGLMHICRSWGTEGCHPDVSDHRYPKEVKDGETIHIWPVGEELKRLDDICKKCDSRVLLVEEEKCPYCDSTDVESTGVSGEAQGWATDYTFRCINCDEIFWISEHNMT